MRTAVCVTTIALLLAALLLVGTALDDVASGKARGGDGSIRQTQAKRHSVVWAVGDGADGGRRAWRSRR